MTPGTRWKNNKTGSFYRIIAVALDCTNAREGDLVVVYTFDEPDNAQWFVRDELEFREKFSEVTK